MTKAFWLFAKRKQVDGVNMPDLPAVSTGFRMTCPGDITRTGVTASHRHLMLGGFAIADDNLIGEVGEGHTHIIGNLNGSWSQITRGATPHTHPLPVDEVSGSLLPDYYMLFVVCSDADMVAIAAHPGCYPIVEADITQLDDGLQIGDLVTTPWTPGEVTLWRARCLNVLGFSLPAEVDRGKRLVAVFLGSLLSRQTNETGLRYQS